MTKEEFAESLNFGSQKRIDKRKICQASKAKGSFPCYIGVGKHVYLGHHNEGKWYKHGFTYDSTGKQIQT